MAELTSKQIKALHWQGKDRKYNCGDNLYLNVREKSKTWLWRGTVDGKRQLKTIGRYEDITLNKARVLAYQMKYQKPEPKKMVFSELADDYLSETDYKQMDRLRERVKYLKTIFGQKNVNNITKFQIVEFVREYRTQSPSMANHYRIHLSQIFKHGIGIGIMEENPAANIPRSASGYKPKSKDRILTNEEIIWLFSQSNTNAHVMRFQLLTGLRVTEALTGEVDGDKYRVTPKGGGDHWVYMTELAKAQLPLPAGRRHSTVSEWCRRKYLEYTPHDCRRSFSTFANDAGTEPFIVERVLGHKMQGMMEIYNRAQYEPERIEAAKTVEKAILEIIS